MVVSNGHGDRFNFQLTAYEAQLIVHALQHYIESPLQRLKANYEANENDASLLKVDITESNMKFVADRLERKALEQ